MQYASRRTGLAISILLVLGSLSASAQSDTDTEAGESVAVMQWADQATAPKPIATFPRLADFGDNLAPLSFFQPLELNPRRNTTPWYFAIVKVSCIAIAILIWLRALSICYTYEESDATTSGAWTWRLFAVGLAGIFIALVLPAYLPGACVLVAAIVVPFYQFTRWQKQYSAAPADPIRWNAFFSNQPKLKQPTIFSLQDEFSLNGAVTTTGAVVQLIGKSPQAIANNYGFSRGAQTSASFQQVLALIDHAVSCHATDLHITTKSDHIELRHRIDGALISLGQLPLTLGLAVINVFKVMCDMNIADRRRSQDGSFLADVNQRRLSFRVSAQGTQTGEKLSIRILDPSTTFSDLSSLGMPEALRQRFTAQLNRTHGLILIVGTTGAGKSTTANAALQSIDPDTHNIVSIEDPIEYQIPNVDQIEVNYRAGQTFQSALRSVLRLDADVILLGEIRDEESARIACQASQTGQLVIATMHANDSVSAALRLVELGQDIQSVTSSLRAVLAQTLVRKLCPQCRISYTPESDELEQVGLSGYAEPIYRSPTASETPCSFCDGRGFLRRTGVYELTEITAPIADLLHQRAPLATLTEAARRNGMTLLREEGLRLVRDGTISTAEMFRIFGSF